MKNASEAILKPLKQKINSRCQKDKTREDAEQKHLSMTSCFNKGFTLIELLVVVLIIGILSAVALPQYQKIIERTRVIEILGVINSIDKSQQIYLMANGKYASNLEELDIHLPGKIEKWNLEPGIRTEFFWCRAGEFPSYAHAYTNALWTCTRMNGPYNYQIGKFNEGGFFCYTGDGSATKFCKSLSNGKRGRLSNGGEPWLM